MTVIILLVTGHLIKENIDYDEAKKTGTVIVLENPFNFNQLIPAIKEILAE